MNTIENIPDFVFDTLLELGDGSALDGVVRLVNSYDASMSEAMTGTARMPDTEEVPEAGLHDADGVPVLNLLATRTDTPPVSTDGLVDWNYLLGSGHNLALDLEMSDLPMPEYDRKKKIIRSTLSPLPEKEWSTLKTLEDIEGQY